MGWIATLTFVWRYVVPHANEIVKIFGLGTFNAILKLVTEAEATLKGGIEKRSWVFSETYKWLGLKNKSLKDISIFGATAIYFMIELAVLNLKKRRENYDEEMKKYSR